MATPPKSFRIGSLVTSTLIGLVVIVLGVSVILPSTKRAHINFQQFQQNDADATGATRPATRSE
jgi:hypothetical protein